ncbi:DUF7681 family protein [Phytohabitans rumicis]|uniref:Acb2/Tad1 domain-containing protein n=1 Tax=Phytohabitans rumicis TaxID=1076125 RepID=UPI0031E5596F
MTTTQFNFWRSTQPSTIEQEFGYHPATPVTGPVHDHVRAMMRTTAHRLNELLPECEPKKLALAALREAMWAANSAVACYGSGDPGWQRSMRDWLALPPERVDDAPAAAAGTKDTPAGRDLDDPSGSSAVATPGPPAATPDQAPAAGNAAPAIGKAAVAKPESVFVRPYVVKSGESA